MFSFLIKHKIIIIIAIAIIGLAFVAKSFLSKTKTQETYTISKQKIVNYVVAEGHIDAKDKADLHFSVPSKLTWIGVKKGDTVRKGQGLAALDRQTIEKNLKKTLLDYQIARSDFEQTQDNYNIDGRKIEEVPSLSDADKRVLQKTQLNLDKAVTDVEIQDVALKEAVLSSPINGLVIDNGDFKVGENLGASDLASRMIRIIDPKSLYFLAEIDEVDYGKIKLGQKAEITLDSFPGKVINGTISYIDKIGTKTNSGSVKVKVDITLDKIDENILTELNGEAKIITDEKENSLVIPKKFVDFKNGKSTVSVLENNKIITKEIGTGMTTSDSVEVTSGLNEGEMVVLK